MTAAHLAIPKTTTTPGTQQYRKAGCVGKYAFRTPSLAHEVRKRAPAQIEAYRCKACGFWHLGASGPDVNRNARIKARLVRREGAVVNP